MKVRKLYEDEFPVVIDRDREYPVRELFLEHNGLLKELHPYSFLKDGMELNPHSWKFKYIRDFDTHDGIICTYGLVIYEDYLSEKDNDKYIFDKSLDCIWISRETSLGRILLTHRNKCCAFEVVEMSEYDEEDDDIIL